MTDYSQNIVKKYKYWTVYVHTNQGYLGRCVIWCNRENADDLGDATTNELNEFHQIIKELKATLEKSFNCDWMNYSFLGNSERHLHCHMVPRYKKDVVFERQTFEDTRWGYNWLLDESFVTSKELLQAIKKTIQDNIEH